MPFTFLIFVFFVLCALVAPLLLIGVAWAICSPRLRQLGFKGAKYGVISAALFCTTLAFLGTMLADDSERSAFSFALAAGAGFTIGVVATYLRDKVKNLFGAVRAGDL